LNCFVIKGNEATIGTIETLAYLNTLVANERIRVLHVTQCANDFDARRHCERRVYEYLIPVAAFGAGLDEEALKGKRKALKQALSAYRGTHGWRNFTRRSNPVLPDNQLQRHIFRASLGENVIVSTPGGGEAAYWLIVLSGEGFLCHMCRKMAGLAFAVAAGRVSEATLERALTQHGEEEASACMEIPTSPGELLYLAECSYAKYEQKHHASVHNAEPCKEGMAAFKRQIREHVAHLDLKDNIFATWADPERGELAKWCSRAEPAAA